MERQQAETDHGKKPDVHEAGGLGRLVLAPQRRNQCDDETYLR
jgi:hypothetical protein